MRLLFLFFASMALSPCADALSQFKVVQQSDRIDVSRAGRVVTSYLFRSGSKPVLWPIHGPDGALMTRSYPMDSTALGEDHDHIHHRSLWMTFGDVDGVDWWAEGETKGTVRHTNVLLAEGQDETATIIAEHEWVSPPANTSDEPSPTILETARYTFSGSDSLLIDCEYVLRSGHTDRNVEFGDTKEGMFAIRVPEAMRADKPSGQILNSHGETGADAWGKSARWVDYSGPVSAPSSKNFGIGILVHPNSFRADGLWHVRTYGLFAHNPMGIKDFMENRGKTGTGSDPAPHAGGYTLEPHGAIHLFYRVVFHRDRWTIEQGNSHWNAFETVPMQLK
jgi:hypothetical protein